MFRFSIRELMVVTVTVAIGVSWFVDHRRLRVALVDANTAIEAAKVESEKARERGQQLTKQVDDELAYYGFRFTLRCVGNKMVKRLVPIESVP